jgi:hypothetical protein
MRILGSVDRCDQAFIDGWVQVPELPERRLGVEFVLNGQVVGYCTADQFREDLQQGGLGDGCYSFSFPTPVFIPQSEVRRIAVKISGSDVYLRTPQGGGADGVDGVAATVSRFGGLWIDRYDWLDRLAGKHRRGEISEEVSTRIFRFVRDGYLVIEGAVAPDLVDRVNDEIEAAWRSPPPGLRVETFEPDGQMHIVPPDISVREGRTKMLDLYAYSGVTREAIAAPAVVEFLAAIFEDRPKAFQGLTFWNGSQQAIHKDTAYVKIDSNPMHLAATWLALEDISPGTGELEYYVGSHRAPDFLFGGVSKWMESHTADHDRFLRSLHEDARAFGHVKGSFLARKGDVLVWHADLAHGGSPVATPGTRRSLVTHFSPASDEPFYRRSAMHAELDLAGCRFVSQFADIMDGPFSHTNSGGSRSNSGMSKFAIWDRIRL